MMNTTAREAEEAFQRGHHESSCRHRSRGVTGDLGRRSRLDRRSRNPADLEGRQPAAGGSRVSGEAPASQPRGPVVLTNKSRGNGEPAATRELFDPSTGIVTLTNKSADGKVMAPAHGEPATIQAPFADSPPLPWAPEPELGRPPEKVPPAPVRAPAPARDGQWVYTSQYGWLFMPYGSQYTSEGSTRDVYPKAYVYKPSQGWTWLAAPWVWGWGAYPYFGPAGPRNYAWYRGLMSAGYSWGTYRGGDPGLRAGGR